MLGTGAKCRDEQFVRRSLAQNGWSGKAAAPRMAPPPELSPTKKAQATRSLECLPDLADQNGLRI